MKTKILFKSLSLFMVFVSSTILNSCNKNEENVSIFQKVNSTHLKALSSNEVRVTIKKLKYSSEELLYTDYREIKHLPPEFNDNVFSIKLERGTNYPPLSVVIYEKINLKKRKTVLAFDNNNQTLKYHFLINRRFSPLKNWSEKISSLKIQSHN